MNQLRSTLALLLLVVYVLLAAGCVGNRTAEITMATHSSTPTIITPIQTQCLPQENTTPWIHINPVSDHYVGDMFEINGTTNLGINDPLSFWITRRPIRTRIPSQVYEIRGIVRTQSRDCDTNVWSFSINTSELGVGYYDVGVGTENFTISNWDLFFLHENFQKGEVV